MQTIVRDERARILRFDRGEDLLVTLQAFCEKEEIVAGTISAIGAAEKIVLSWYDLIEKKYVDVERDEQLEIVALNGNVSSFKGKPIIHAHGCFSDRTMTVIAGHVKSLIVGATCELRLNILRGKMERGHDAAVGLHLLQ